MTARKLDGEDLAARIRGALAERIGVLRERGVVPGLGTMLVGDDGPSAKYVGMKHRDAAELGIRSFDERLPADATAAQVAEVVDRWNADVGVDAFILQYPFPSHLDYESLVLRMDPAKDADGLHP